MTLSKNAAKLFASPKSVILFTLIIFILNSCKKELLETERSDVKKVSNVEISSISYRDFLHNVNLSKLGALASTLSASGKTKSLEVYGADTTPFRLQLTEDSVKVVKKGDTLSYVMAIKPTSPRAVTFQNLTVQIVGGHTNAFITSYTPTKQWIKNWREGRPIAYEGEVAISKVVQSELSKGGNGTAVQSSTAKVMLAPGECEYYTLTIVTAYPCSTGCWPGTCDWEGTDSILPAGHFLPGYNITIQDVVNCMVPGASAPPSSGGGGGGTTTPNPGGDYNPCDGGGNEPTVANARGKISYSSKLMAHENPDCNPQPPTLPEVPDANDYSNAFQRLVTELGITNSLEIAYLQTNGNVFVAVNNYLNSNSWSEDSKDFVKWAVGYLVDFPDSDINELIANNNIPNSNINLPILDTSELTNYPAFKALVEDLPNFLNTNPKILKALEATTGFSKTKIMQLMQPGKGPKVRVVTDLRNSQGDKVIGNFNRDTNPNLLRIDAAYVNGLSSANNTLRIKELGFILLITTLHEFVHYGRATNDLSKFINQPGWGDREAGNYFEDDILPPGATRLEPASVNDWLKYYKIRIIPR